MIPLFEQDGFIICFEALDEDRTERQHFVKECGWSEKDFRAYQRKQCAWFCAKVSAWKDGEEMGVDYLGACSYDTVEDFYTKYKDDYFKDMVNEALHEAKGKSCTS